MNNYPIIILLWVLIGVTFIPVVSYIIYWKGKELVETISTRFIISLLAIKLWWCNCTGAEKQKRMRSLALDLLRVSFELSPKDE